ncbi:MAG: DUF2520 domain-containing protein [Deltaproteobacteria bacterium]|nr:MAG: DUF2520 domain-containing protein [Deltaproteobacteria bacterium]
MHITLVGPGRLGRSLAQLLPRVGVEVRLLGRGAPIDADTDAVLLTVPDAAIRTIRDLPEGTPVLHCSGATEVAVLHPHHPAGSFHPLMTFPGPEVGLPDLTGVTAALAGDPEALTIGRELAERLGMRPLVVPGDRRLYHAAAVMAGNFATVLLAEACEVLVAAGVPREEAAGVLAPLALRSLANAVPDPSRALTGPVARGDHAVIENHRRALNDAGLVVQRELYDALNMRALSLISANSPIRETQGDTDPPDE